MKKVIAIVLIFLACLIIFCVGTIRYMLNGLDDIPDLSFNEIDLSLLEDGSYFGNFELGRFSNEIEVIIRDNEIVEINIIEDVKFSRQHVIDELFEEVEEKQDITVDTVSGATVTSNAYLKSIEDALIQ